MGGKGDRYHEQVEREWATNRPRKVEEHAPAPEDSPLLHPANEGHDKERKLDQVEAWSAEDSVDAEETRRLREMDPCSHVQGGPLGGERFVDQRPEPTPSGGSERVEHPDRRGGRKRRE